MKLYKYMSENVALEFIKHPLLRITPRQALNDPFECLPSTSIKNKLELHIEKDVRPNLKEKQVIIIEEIEKFMKLHGIISLTESPDNLLMWSHYGEEHKGMVVEFNIDEKNPFSLFNTNQVHNESDGKFGRVSYRKSREYPYNITTNSIKDIRYYYYLSKADEWIYEKEYRYITPFSLVNYIKKDNEKSIVNCLLEHEALRDTWLNSHKTNELFLININECCIGNIFLGANANIDKYTKAFKDAEVGDYRKNYYSSFTSSYLNVMQAEIDPDRYELKFNNLNNKKC